MGADRKIGLAEASHGALVRLECGRGREALTSELIVDAARFPGLVVGLDFAFSLPAWFLDAHALRSAPE